MTLTKNFLHKEPDFFNISRFKMIIGVLVGLFFSFTIYSFLYLMREGFRILSVTEAYYLWILTDKEVYFYNLFFAFIAVIIGQSVTFIYWLDRPNSLNGKQNHRKISIVNDQRALNCYFLSWFSILAFVFVLMFGLSIDGGFYVISIYPDYNYIFILIVVVLFLQTWNTIRLTFKRNSLKWMLSSFLIISAVAFGLSRVNLIDYNKINNYYLQNNIHHNYNLELPETDNYEIQNRRSLTKNIYIVEAKEQKGTSKPIIVVDNEEVNLERLPKMIMDWRSKSYESDIPHLIYRLHIHKTIKMGFINQLKNELSKLGITKIAYVVTPTNPKYDKRYYQDFSFSMFLPDWNAEGYSSKEVDEELNKIQNIIEIKQTGSDYLINESLIEKNQIKYTIKKLIQHNSDFIIKLYENDNVDFSDYFRVLSSTKEALTDLRNEYSEKIYSKQYELLDYEEKKIVIQKLPFRVFEY